MSLLDTDQAHFKSFAKALERAIKRYGDLSTETLLDRQKRQVEALIALERHFKKALLSHPWGPSVYKMFISHICDEKRNILAARPFFRERQDIFTKYISKCLKKRRHKGLYKFRFNYQFVRFAVKAKKWNKNSKIIKLSQEITEIRNEIAEMNMPLAINRARLFWNKTPKLHLSYMDLVQISSEGLMAAIDKFVLPYSPVFRSVIIGRSVGNMIDAIGETLVHFYPSDKRKIYRANKVMRQHADGVDYEKLAGQVNDGVEPSYKTDPIEIADLMAAASCVSADSNIKTDNEQKEVAISRFSAPESVQPDIIVENTNALNSMSNAISKLSIIEQKLLKLKGITL